MESLRNIRPGDIPEILSYLYTEYIIYLQIASIALSAFFIYIILYAGIRSKFVQNKLEPLIDTIGVDEFAQRKAIKGWTQIERRMAEGGEANLRLAIIEADKVLDSILKMSGFRGDSLGDRLKQITPAQISNIQDIWRVHKIRNQIVHEPGHRMTREDAEWGIATYKRALQQLSLLD